MLSDWHGWLAVRRFKSTLYSSVAQIHLVDALLFKRLIRAGASLRLTPLIPQLIVAVLLLLGNSRLVQALVHRSVEETASSGTCKVLLLLHDLAGALRNQRLLLDVACGSPVPQSLVHLSLPRLVVLREGHVEVRRIVLLLFGLRRISDLVRLESAVAQRIALGHLIGLFI